MKINFRSTSAAALAGVTLLSACKSDPDTGNGVTADSAVRGAGTAKAGSGMQRMRGGMMSGMMDSMQTHMGMMEGVSADDLKAMLPAHREMAANMLSRLNGEMRTMNMQPDENWKTLTDSIRRDLARMPEVSAAETHRFMAGHSGRMMRLMQMHQTMMGGMNTTASP